MNKKTSMNTIEEVYVKSMVTGQPPLILTGDWYGLVLGQIIPDNYQNRRYHIAFAHLTEKDRPKVMFSGTSRVIQLGLNHLPPEIRQYFASEFYYLLFPDSSRKANLLDDLL